MAQTVFLGREEEVVLEVDEDGEMGRLKPSEVLLLVTVVGFCLGKNPLNPMAFCIARDSSASANETTWLDVGTPVCLA